MSSMNKNAVHVRCRALTVMALAFLLFLFPMRAFSAQQGWKRVGTEVSYYRDGEKLTGYQKVGKYHYYFNEDGVLQTGWVKTSEGIRYFRKDGKFGKLGRQFTSVHEIDGDVFGFQKKTGLLRIGLQTFNGKTYFFKKKGALGVIGRAYKDKWITVKKNKYYLGPDGVMVKNAWVKDTWYVDKDGKRLVSTYTPDGYEVDASGKKTGKKLGGWEKKGGKWYYFSLKRWEYLKKTWIKVGGKLYYVDKNGVRVTGFVRIGDYKYYLDPDTGEVRTGPITIKGKDYYFQENGHLLVKGSENGYKTNKKGVITRRPKHKVLIVAGHCRGSDSGANSALGDETDYTRVFAKLIIEKLKAKASVDQEYYLNGDINRSMYSLHARYLNGVTFTGNGKNKEKVLSVLKAHPTDLVDLTQYDYVLEIHFNATGYAAKDVGGDGNYKGLGFYMSTARTSIGDTVLEKKVAAGIRDLGFRLWGGGILNWTNSSGIPGDLYNMKVCRELGVKYALLETAFIDDKDDMTFFNNNKDKMAQVVADAIASVYN